MLDLSPRWSLPVGDAFSVAGLKIRRLLWRQALVSGDIAAAANKLGIAMPAVGAYCTATGDCYGVSIARDRLLAVSRAYLGLEEGWHEPGYGFTEVTDGSALLEIRGDGLELLRSRACNAGLVEGSPSARFEFAGLFCLAYFHRGRDTLRVHVDRGHAAYLLTWIARSVGAAPTAIMA